MTFGKSYLCFTASLLALAVPVAAHAQSTTGTTNADAATVNASDTASTPSTDIVVTGQATTYNNSEVSKEMLMQVPPLTGPLSAINKLPGVNVNEGDTFGFDDWSAAVEIRGFQDNLNEQQIGMTIDGMPNGNSNYGGGSKANRYIDSMNIGGIAVAQGTSDIASRSTEALGGTIDYRTSDPLDTQRMRVSGSLGQFQSKRAYARYDTGLLFNDQFKAWISASHQEATDWVNGSAGNRRDNIAAKIQADLGSVKLTSYGSYDDAVENNYQRLFSAADYAADPHWDQLIGNWTGVPYVDQLYRPAWGTLRTNYFAYLKADARLSDTFNLHLGGYYHHNNGRGDWAPPYLVDVHNDGAGNPQSEYTGGVTYKGGAPLGTFVYVDSNGAALSPADGCTSTITFPYGGAGPKYDPSCYPAGAIPVQSYRNTVYKKRRLGFTADFDWETQLGAADNLLRGGVWYEDTRRTESREWHKVIDARIGDNWDRQPYWIQYSRVYPQTVFKWYAEDQVTLGSLTLTGGLKQFSTTLKRNDLFGESSNISVNSKSKVLLSGGVQWRPAVRGLEFFAGYAENFKSLSDNLLEVSTTDFTRLKPETARNIDAGVRYNHHGISASATFFDIKFNNRVVYLAPGATGGPNYLNPLDGSYFNAGGIKSRGVELAANVHLLPTLALYGSYTYTDSTYLGTGATEIDLANNIYPGTQVTGIPKNMFVTSLDWHNGPFRAGISGKYTGSRYVNYRADANGQVNLANSWKADGYFLADLYVGVRGERISQTLKGMELTLNVNNLLDKDYLGGISGGGAWIGAPRTTVLTATFDF
ncbi:TonB-dependent receptor domain-containing protein [Stakelama marina]|nr:TonB-dependent receptor [Stakelama marina]